MKIKVINLRRNDNMEGKENTKFKKGQTDQYIALIFMKDNVFQVYKMFQEENIKKVYKKVNLEEVKVMTDAHVRENSVHIVRLIVDSNDDNKFAMIFYFNFYEINIGNIINKGMIASLIDAMERYYIVFQNNWMEIDEPDDILNVLRTVVEDFKI
jgi:hypothetical protein